MKAITVNDRKFAVSIPEADILRQVSRVASEINRDYADKKPVFLAVLNGSFMFAADLLREISLDCEIHFVKMTSYLGTQSTGEVHDLIGITGNIENRDIIIVEDIIESGLTMQHMLSTLAQYKPSSISICSLLVKPEKIKVPLDIKYVAFEISNDFIVGYGLDYDGSARNLRDIYSLVK